MPENKRAYIGSDLPIKSTYCKGKMIDTLRLVARAIDPFIKLFITKQTCFSQNNHIHRSVTNYLLAYWNFKLAGLEKLKQILSIYKSINSNA
jgi:hypothetical protein